MIPKINDQNRSFCEEPFNIEDLFNIVKRMPNNKSPGPDGLPLKFEKSFGTPLSFFFMKPLLSV